MNTNEVREVVLATEVIKELEDIVIDYNEYLNSVREKIELIEGVAKDLRADFEKAQDLTVHFHQTIEELKQNFGNEDVMKIKTEHLEHSFRPQTSKGNSSNSLSQEEKEKQELRARLLAKRPVIQNTGIRTIMLPEDEFHKNYFEVTHIAYEKVIELPEFFYNPKPSLFPRIIAFNKVNPELVYKLFTYGYLNLLYPSISLIELQKFPEPMLQEIRKYSKNSSHICLRIFSVSPEKDEGKVYPAINLIILNKIFGNNKVQATKERAFEIPPFDKSWINYRRSTGALAVKCQVERLCTTGAKTLYREGTTIIVTTDGNPTGKIDDELFDFGYYKLEPHKFEGSQPVKAKFTELYQREKDKQNQGILT